MQLLCIYRKGLLELSLAPQPSFALSGPLTFRESTDVYGSDTSRQVMFFAVKTFCSDPDYPTGHGG